MKLKGQAQLDLNNISISDLDYELNLTHSDLGVATKKKDGNNENGICLESNLGPIIIKFDLLTDKNNIPTNLKDLNMYLTASYKLEDNISIGLKYETDGEQKQIEVKAISTSNNSKSFIITQNELSKSKTYSNYYVYCVTKVNSENPEILRIKNPDFEKNDEFLIKPLTYKITFE